VHWPVNILLLKVKMINMFIHERSNDSKWKVAFIINCYFLCMFKEVDHIKQCVA
jgi:hypothetical protein